MSTSRGSGVLSRTRWAELHVEGFVSPTFVSEFVFRSPQVMDGGIQREVVDLLIARGESALLVSQKCQEDPAARSRDKVLSWARKQAARAVSQLKGALRRVGQQGDMWCDHPRRGRVRFRDGLPRIDHAIATIEVFEPIQLQSDLPMESQGTRISFLSVSDFLNLSRQLRTVPELVRYLDERRLLPDHELRIIGDEQIIFNYYLLHDASLTGFGSRANAKRTLAPRSGELADAIEVKASHDRFSRMLEHVADELSVRDPSFQRGLSHAVLSKYEPAEERRAYLVMQDILAGMKLAERVELGRMFHGAIEDRKAKGAPGFTFAATLLDSRPDWVFVFGSFGESEAWSREKLLATFHPLANDAMLHYSRRRCLLIVDRDGKSYETAIAELTGPASSKGDYVSKVFGPLKMSSRELHFRPIGIS